MAARSLGRLLFVVGLLGWLVAVVRTVVVMTETPPESPTGNSFDLIAMISSFATTLGAAPVWLALLLAGIIVMVAGGYVIARAPAQSP